MATPGSKSRGRAAVNRALGEYLVGLRLAKGWTQNQAAFEAEKRKIDTSYDKIRGLESGTRHYPAPDLLRPLAALYGVEYDEIVRQMVRLVYGSDLAGHTSGGESSTSQADREVPNAADAALGLSESKAADGPLSLDAIASAIIRLGDLARESLTANETGRPRRGRPRRRKGN